MIDRYDFDSNVLDIEPQDDGRFVLHSDYAALEAEVERMKADMADTELKVKVNHLYEAKLKDDIADLVTALDEATTHTGYTRWLTPHETEFIPDPKSTKKYRCFDDLTPESRAVAERWLKEEEK